MQRLRRHSGAVQRAEPGIQIAGACEEMDPGFATSSRPGVTLFISDPASHKGEVKGAPAQARTSV